MHTQEKLIRRGHQADLTSLLEIASGQTVQDTNLGSDSSVRFSTSLPFDVTLHNLAGFRYFYIIFLKFPLLKMKKIGKRQADVKCLMVRLSEREFCSHRMQLHGDIHPWHSD